MTVHEGSGPFSAATYAYAQVHSVHHPISNSSHAIRRRSFLVLFVAFSIVFILMATSVFNNIHDEENNLNDDDALTKDIEFESTKPKPVMLDKVDPDEFEKEIDGMLEENNEVPSSSNNNKTTTSIKTPQLYDFDYEMPKDCKSRRNDHPGDENGTRVHFIHIPRSGGNSVEESMKRWARSRGQSLFTSSLVTVSGSDSKCPSGSLEHLFLAGHQGYGFCDDVKNDPNKYFSFTVMRDPIARIVSLFDLDIRKYTSSKSQIEEFATTSLVDLVKQYNSTEEEEPGETFLKYLLSEQARFVCGYECFRPQDKSLNEPENIYPIAMKNLRKLDAIGVPSRMDELIDQLKLHLRWIPVGFKVWPRQEVEKGTVRTKLDEDARAILTAWSREDMLLYRLADKLASEKTTEARRCMREMERLAKKKLSNKADLPN